MHETGLFRYAMREEDEGKGGWKEESAARREYGVVGRGEEVSGGRGSYFAFFCVSSWNSPHPPRRYRVVLLSLEA